MKENAMVKEVKGNMIVVSLKRVEACKKCRACAAGLKEEETVIEVKNNCNASVGDYVSIDMDNIDFFKAVIIMYGIPLLGLLLGITIGQVLKNEVLSLILPFLFMGISYLYIKLNEPRYKKSNCVPVATEIVKY